MPTTRPWASKVLCHFIEPNVSVNDLQQKLDRTLHPYVKAPHTGRFNHHAVVQIP
jgi:hypothetical protein